MDHAEKDPRDLTLDAVRDIRSQVAQVILLSKSNRRPDLDAINVLAALDEALALSAPADPDKNRESHGA